MKAVTLALHADGTSSLVHGIEVPLKVQRATVRDARNTKLTAGVESLEIWQRSVLKRAVSDTAKATRRARTPQQEPKPEKVAAAPKLSKKAQAKADKEAAALAAGSDSDS